MINYILILISFFALVSCTSVKENVVKKPIPSHTKIALHLFDKDSTFLITILMVEQPGDSLKDTFLNIVRSISITPEFITKNRNWNFEISNKGINKFGIKIPEIQSCKVLFGESQPKLDFDENDNFDIFKNDLLAVNFDFHTNNGIYTIRKTKEELYKKSERILELIPIVIAKDENKIDLGIFTYRHNFTDEYIPNSETFRIVVTNFKGKQIYSSQSGANYMQVIYPVYPETIGGTYLYWDTWNYKDSEGNNIVLGDYNIEMIIPALPKPYRTEFFYERK